MRRTPDGLTVSLGRREREVLGSLPSQLLAIVEGAADGDLAEAVRRRLFPVAHHDPELEREYRELVGDALVEQRTDALQTFARTLSGGEVSGSGWNVELEPEEADAWLTVVNDTRLTLAQVVGITTEADWERGPDPEDPASAMLFYLGWLEDELVAAMMGTLDG